MIATTAAEAFPPKLSSKNLEKRFFITIPPYNMLTDEQRTAVNEGGDYPIYVGEFLPEHETMLDFLIERALAAWQR